jgi:hypothetical protein
MATLTIKLESAGSCSGPVDLYSNANFYTTPFATNVSITILTSTLGYNISTSLVPTGTTIVRIKNNNANCDNYVEASIVSQYTSGFGLFGAPAPHNNATDACSDISTTPVTEYWHNGDSFNYIPPVGSFLYDDPDPATASLLALDAGWYKIGPSTTNTSVAAVQIALNGYEVLCCTTLCSPSVS